MTQGNGIYRSPKIALITSITGQDGARGERLRTVDEFSSALDRFVERLPSPRPQTMSLHTSPRRNPRISTFLCSTNQQMRAPDRWSRPSHTQALRVPPQHGMNKVFARAVGRPAAPRPRLSTKPQPAGLGLEDPGRR